MRVNSYTWIKAGGGGEKAGGGETGARRRVAFGFLYCVATMKIKEFKRRTLVVAPGQYVASWKEACAVDDVVKQ